MKKLIIAAIALLATGVTVQAGLEQYVGKLVSYVHSNGTVRAGIGGTVSEIANGNLSAVLIQQVNIASVGSESWKWNIGVAHTTCFSDNLAHEGVGLGIETVKAVKQLRWLTLPVFQDIDQVRVGITAAPDIDRAVAGQFDQRHFVIGLTAGWRFR